MGNIHIPSNHETFDNFLKKIYNHIDNKNFKFIYNSVDFDTEIKGQTYSIQETDKIHFYIKLNDNKKNIYEKNIDTDVSCIDFLYGAYIQTDSNICEHIFFKLYIDNILLSIESQNTNTLFTFNCSAIPIHFMKQKNDSLQLTVEIMTEGLVIEEIYFAGFSSCFYSVQNDYNKIKELKAISFSKTDENCFSVITYVKNSFSKKDILFEELMSLKDITIPLHYTEKYKEVLAKFTSTSIRDELIQVALHPNRLTSFLSIDIIKSWHI